MRLLLLFLAWPIWTTGQATYYDPGVMEQVWANRRGTLAACPECVGQVALLDAAQLGDRVWISNGREWVGPLHVIDCAATQDRARLLQKGWVADLPWWLARRWGMRGPIHTAVSFIRPLSLEEEDYILERMQARYGQKND